MWCDTSTTRTTRSRAARGELLQGFEGREGRQTPRPVRKTANNQTPRDLRSENKTQPATRLTSSQKFRLKLMPTRLSFAVSGSSELDTAGGGTNLSRHSLLESRPGTATGADK